MIPLILLAALVSAFGHALDLHSTALALANGAVEADPEARFLIETGGIGLFAAYKAALLASIAGLSALLVRLQGALGATISYSAFLLAGFPAWAISAHNYALAERLGW